MSQRNSVNIKSILALGIILFLLLIWTTHFTYAQSEGSSFSQLNTTPYASTEISMDFKNASIKDALKIFSQQSGLNFIASEKVKDRTLTLYLDKVSVEDALNTIMSANKLTYELKKDSNIFVVKEDDQPEIETVTKIFPLQYARLGIYKFTEEDDDEESSSESSESSDSESSESSDSESNDSESSSNTKPGIKDVVEKLLSTNGKLTEDYRTNSLIVTDVAGSFAKIEEVIAKLDVPLPQVMIEVEVIETKLDTIDKLGIEWGNASTGELASVAGAKRNSTYPFTRDVYVNDTTDGSFVSFGYVSAENLKATLALLHSDTNTKILARPKILALTNETATIEIVSDTSIGSQTTTTSAEGTSQSVTAAERATTGISLEVTPYINSLDEITMLVEPEITDTTTSSALSGTLDTQKRSAKTAVSVKDGETIIIGGLIKTYERKILSKVPFLGDMPLLGYLFRKYNDTGNDQELVVFITPHLRKYARTSPKMEQAEAQVSETAPEHKEDEIEKILNSLEE